MEKGLTVEEVKELLDRLSAATTREECRSCDCLQGFIVQLELDAAEDVRGLTEAFKVSREQVHGCLGCEPCPPAELFSEYIRRGKDS
jgi:hypothetical protein